MVVVVELNVLSCFVLLFSGCVCEVELQSILECLIQQKHTNYRSFETNNLKKRPH